MADDDRFELVVDVFEGRNFPKISEGKGVVVQAVVNDAVRATLRPGGLVARAPRRPAARAAARVVVFFLGPASPGRASRHGTGLALPPVGAI